MWNTYKVGAKTQIDTHLCLHKPSSGKRDKYTKFPLDCICWSKLASSGGERESGADPRPSGGINAQSHIRFCSVPELFNIGGELRADFLT